MNRFIDSIRLVTVATAMCAANLWADEPVGEVRPVGVAMVVIGDFPEEQVERVRSFVEHHSGIPVVLLDQQADVENELAGKLDALQHLRTPEYACAVFLYAGEESYDEHAVYRYETRVGVVNIPAIHSDDEEQFLRRAEKLTIRSVGLLLDVPMVPNPQSAMWTYRTMEELDWMGRNFDPPSLMRLQQNAHDLGIPLVADSPYLLLGPRF